MAALGKKAIALAAVFAAGLALALSGCGDDDESSDVTTLDTTTKLPSGVTTDDTETDDDDLDTDSDTDNDTEADDPDDE